MWLVKLSGYDTPESVRELRNYTLLIREDERDPDEDLEGDHEFYVQVVAVVVFQQQLYQFNDCSAIP